MFLLEVVAVNKIMSFCFYLLFETQQFPGGPISCIDSPVLLSALTAIVFQYLYVGFIDLEQTKWLNFLARFSINAFHNTNDNYQYWRIHKLHHISEKHIYLAVCCFQISPEHLIALIMTRGRKKLHRGVLKLVIKYLSEVKMLEVNGSVFLDYCYVLFCLFFSHLLHLLMQWM